MCELPFVGFLLSSFTVLWSVLKHATHHDLLSSVMERNDGVSAALCCLCPADSGVIVSRSVSRVGGGGDAYTPTQTAHSSRHQTETMETNASHKQHTRLL